MIRRLAGREGHAAVAEQCGRDPVPTDRRQQRIPADLGIEVRMQVDEAWGHEFAGRIDLFRAPGTDFADGGDHVPVDGDVGSRWFAAGPVGYRAIADDEIVGHQASPAVVLPAILLRRRPKRTPRRGPRSSTCQGIEFGLSAMSETTWQAVVYSSQKVKAAFSASSRFERSEAQPQPSSPTANALCPARPW